jgi:membrane protease subunit HflC
MSGKGLIGIIVLVAVAAVLASAIYTVDERERALVFKCGEIVRSNDEPGLHFKTPFINTVKKYDARIQTMDAGAERYLTVEKKNLVVDSFVKWRIRDVAKYYVTVSGLVSSAQARLSQRVNDALREEFGKRTVQEVISGDRATIMDVVQKKTNEQAQEIGVEVVDVRLKRVDLDPEVSETVYQRMVAERSRVAKELRAKGAEQAEIIRANAEKRREIMVAEAFRDSEILRGEGDATATKVYADAFGEDAEFFGLYRSLNAYKQTFSSEDDLIVLEPSSEFFKYFNNARPNGVQSPVSDEMQASSMQ